MNLPKYSEIGTHPEDESARDYFNIPDYKSEMDDAKTFLQKVSPYTGDNIYDHLSEVLNKILAERPENVIDFFEEYSRKVKEQRYKPLTDHLKDIYICPMQYEYTKKIMPYLKPLPALAEERSTVDPADEEILDPDKRDLLKICYYFEKAGISLPKTELYCLELSMRNLAKAEKLQDIRFWGKIYGLHKNYIVIEAELSEEDIEKRNQIAEKAEEEEEVQSIPGNEVEEALAIVARDQEQYGEGVVKSKIPRPLPPLPLSNYTQPPEAPVEPCGEGVNKKVYYVCNEIGDIWVQLPDVTPQQIVAARKIVKHFTGNLDTEVVSYPKFLGTEMHYLRAQIARISAGTQISPLGYFTFKSDEVGGEEEEEEEDVEEEEEGGGAKTSYKLNKRYEPHPMTDLTDMSMSFWVHHTQYILPQGRTKWWNPNPKSFEGGEEEMGEEEEDEEEDKGGMHAEPETGPALLTPLSGDASLEAVPAWTVRSTSVLFPEHAAAVVSSNLWPGAFAITCGKFVENIYIGNGQKHFAHNFSPAPLPYIQEEYPMGPEVMEMTDPTADMEEAWRVAHEKPPPALKLEGEEEQEEEEEEEEEDDDDDEDDEDDD